MQIDPPFGYSEIVPLYKNQKVRLPAAGALPEFCRKVNAVRMLGGSLNCAPLL